MIKSLYKIAVICLITACSNETKTEASAPPINATNAIQKSLPDYESFYKLFSLVELPYTLSIQSIGQCNNGHFSLKKNDEKLKRDNYLSVEKLNCLTNTPPINKEHSQFVEWYNEHLEILDNRLHQAMPGIVFKNSTHTFLTLYTFSRENDIDKGFWEVWLIKINEQYEIIDFKKMGIMGNSSFLEEGEEDGAKYEIMNTDHEYFTAVFNIQQCDITLTRWSTRKGQDWRIDQNLKVDESTARDDVHFIYKY